MTAPAGTTEPAISAAPVASRAARMRAPLLVAGATVAGCALLLAVDPNEPGHYPTCPTKLLSGLDCPFCGGMRCTRSLLTGDLAGAVDHNALVVALAPFAIVLWVVWAWSRWTGRELPSPGPRANRALLWAAIVAMVAWTVVRNIPAGSYFASGLA
jgi:hypothetical protein